MQLLVRDGQTEEALTHQEKREGTRTTVKVMLPVKNPNFWKVKRK